MQRNRLSTGTVWEDKVGYSRAIRVGNQIEVSGTVAVDGNKVMYENDAYGQTKFIIQKISDALAQLGSSLNDVIRTRIFVTDISKWEEIGRAHGEFFYSIKPATSMVQVAALIQSGLLVEIEVTAVCEK